ncbi:MAG TPA: uridine diphosphate-N-acetylglucosamine-binding protein YvcK [Acidimicrobiales bacterium]|nr:uridine diphosphate-N-acetylglucosamine-binding protein YvcK [Acidimicrobiales bacterium]
MSSEGSARPNVVALGGGHGLATTLSAVRRYAGTLTAIVSVADDGGSSGKLRDSWVGPAPGDIRRCLLSLADTGQVWARALDHRFGTGELAGHSLGNLVLVALAETMGGVVPAAKEVGRLLGVEASVLPATETRVELKAELASGEVVAGQTSVSHAPSPVRRVWLEPGGPPAPAEALEAIAAADQVVIGPGSLFTSILAACAVPGILAALDARSAGRVYVCNLRPQESETAGFDADAHLGALAAHGVIVDAVACDPATVVGMPSVRGLTVLANPRLVSRAMAKPNGHSHDPALLAAALRDCLGAG